MMLLLAIFSNLLSAAVPDGLKLLHTQAQGQSELLDAAQSREEQARERKDRPEELSSHSSPVATLSPRLILCQVNPHPLDAATSTQC